MSEYKLCNDYIELIAGNSNIYSREYMEASDNIKQNNQISMGYLKNFITSIENIANKKETKDKRISDSKGNLKQFVGYDNIKFAIEFIQKNLVGATGLRDLVTIHDKLIDYQSKYTDAYTKNCRLAMLEYESAVYLLVTGLSMLIANNMEVIQNGSSIKIQKTNESTHGIIDQAIKDLATQLVAKGHAEYLDSLIKACDDNKTSTNVTESTTFTEANIGDILGTVGSIFGTVGNIGKAGVNIVKTAVKSVFGIVPLIRSIMYLKYKKKADTINSLDEQCAFIRMNIDQLNNRTNIDPEKKAEIIKKQEATIERYQKKAAKLRAELMEQEKDATKALDKENPELKKTNDDFVLEGIDITSDFFVESAFGDKLKTYNNTRKILNAHYKSFVEPRINSVEDPKTRKILSSLIITDLDDNTLNVTGEAIAAYDMYAAVEDGDSELGSLLESTAGFNEFIDKYTGELQRLLPNAYFKETGDEQYCLDIVWNEYNSALYEFYKIANTISNYVNKYYINKFGPEDYLLKYRYISTLAIEYDDTSMEVLSIRDSKIINDINNIAREYHLDVLNKPISIQQQIIHDFCMNRINIDQTVQLIQQFISSQNYDITVSKKTITHEGLSSNNIETIILINV